MRSLVILVPAVLLLAAMPARGQEPPTELEVKAAFIVNFLRFTTWPGETAGDLNVCAIGKSELASAVRVAVAGKTVHNRPLVFRLNSYPSAGDCQVLVADSAQFSLAAALIASLSGSPVLTIGNGPGWVDMGGMIELVTEDRRVRFDTNLLAARTAGLHLSANLLQLSRRVRR